MTIWNKGRWHLCLALVLAACGATESTTEGPVDTTVPTVAFVTFESGSFEVRPDGEKLLRDAARYVRRFDNVTLSIAGHVTDGELAVDPDLDVKRIEESVRLLTRFGVKPEKIIKIPRDNAEKVDANDPESEANRRVDVLFVVTVEQTAEQQVAAAPQP